MCFWKAQIHHKNDKYSHHDELRCGQIRYPCYYIIDATELRYSRDTCAHASAARNRGDACAMIVRCLCVIYFRMFSVLTQFVIQHYMYM